jgi:hypothetical protein
VFNAWTDPVLVKRWWGPRGYTTPSAEIDLRVGGAFRAGSRLTYAVPAAFPIGGYRHIQHWFASIEERDAWKKTAPPTTG